MSRENIKEKKYNKMEAKEIFPLLMSMSLPMMLSMLVQSLYNIVDSIYVSRLGTRALTAVSLAYPLQNIVISVAVGIGVGISSVLSISLGEKNQERANQAAATGLVLTVFHCILFVLAGIVVTKPFLCLFTQDKEVLAQACEYTYTVLCVSFGALLQVAMEKIYQGIGDMKTTMYLLGTGCIINIILDPILIFGMFGFPKMGVKGAAAATVIGQISAFVLYIVVYLKKNPGVTLHPRYIRFDKKLIRQIYAVGIPSSLMMMMPSVLVGGLNGILAGMSEVYVAVLGIYFKLQTFIYMPANGIVQGMRPIIGYNYGAGNRKRVKAAIRYSLLAAAVLMLAGTILSLGFPAAILGMFQADTALLNAGTQALRLISLGFLVSSVGIISCGVFEAMGKGMQSLLISLLRQLIIILPLGFVLSRFMGAAGIWVSFPAAELLAALAACVLMKKLDNGKYFPFGKGD
ncbi:MATE family efflux transporter [Faecalicatena acetigenes]|uniref:Probable multidrug resistance protein NorM n=1 Tax=Faecalicatena acetigenes TaxID=2981790 RepID=A0ABT2TEI1_9FIRM|nr:MATE family efflux transporter [Faecalicatena acetigenes]MCU6748693.1 MATE family efflux transporter [Faecalicatena acetigenes]SCI59000.1 Multidrug export protein mepA [uncultured Clostridium sp.]